MDAPDRKNVERLSSLALAVSTLLRPEKIQRQVVDSASRPIAAKSTLTGLRSSRSQQAAKQKLADPAYVKSMTAKYGDPQVWSFSCPYLKEDLPE